MTDLIERLSVATEGSRELDWDISRAIHGATLGPDPADNKMYHCQPAYTTSVDAALSLVPEGWDWRVGNGDEEYGGFSNVWPTPQPYPAHLDFIVEAATPALALCIAALRARESGHD